jgi:hypothetical protein
MRFAQPSLGSMRTVGGRLGTAQTLPTSSGCLGTG